MVWLVKQRADVVSLATRREIAAATPEAVWHMLEWVAPRCPRLRGITLERMEGTVDRLAVAPLREELRRIRTIARALP